MVATTWATCLVLGHGCRSTQMVAPAHTVVEAAISEQGHDASVQNPTVAATVAAAPAVLSEASVRAVVDAWLAAQNGGDLAAYTALYAERFQGIRRSGPRTRAFDRAGWMTDRGAMFRSPMRVSLSDVTIASFSTAATVRFTQDFTQQTFHDTGSKEIVVVQTSQGLRIAREEMLASQIVGAPASMVANTGAAAVFHVFTHGSSQWVALSSHDDVSNWAGGAAELLQRNQVVVTRKRANASVPQELRALSGQAVRAFASNGTACEARLGELQYRTALARRTTRWHPHFPHARCRSG
jgi:ketosteroid isomerase-like protein